MTAEPVARCLAPGNLAFDPEGQSLNPRGYL